MSGCVFLIDADGLLKVSAVEPQSGKKASVDIQPSGGLSKKQLDRIVGERGGGDGKGEIEPPPV